MATSSREVKPFGAFVVPVFTCFLSPAAEVLSERVIGLLGRFQSVFVLV